MCPMCYAGIPTRKPRRPSSWVVEKTDVATRGPEETAEVQRVSTGETLACLLTQLFGRKAGAFGRVLKPIRDRQTRDYTTSRTAGGDSEHIQLDLL